MLKPLGLCVVLLQLFSVAGMNDDINVQSTGLENREVLHKLHYIVKKNKVYSNMMPNQHCKVVRKDVTTFIHQTVIAMEEDMGVMMSAVSLFEKFSNASTLLKFVNGTQQILRGNPLASRISQDIVLVGHGRQSPSGDIQVAGYGPQELASVVSTIINERIFGYIYTISLISCNVGHDQHFLLLLLRSLQSYGVEAKLHLHDTHVSVSSDGEIMSRSGGVWRSHDHMSSFTAQLNQKGDLRVSKLLGCAGPAVPTYQGTALYLQTLEWPSHPQMFVPAELRKKYVSIDCLEGLTWSLFFEENERTRAPDYIADGDPRNLEAVWLTEPKTTEYLVLKHLTSIQDLLVEIRYNAREEVTQDLYYVLNECIYKVHGRNLSVSLVGKFMNTASQLEVEGFRQNFGDQQGEASLQELRQGLKASKFNDFCRQTFQFQQCTYNCERWGRYFMAAVFSASVRNFRTFSLFLMSVIGCEVGRSRGSDSLLCSAFVGDEHPMLTHQPWPDRLGKGFYGCTVENYEMAPQDRQIWLDEVVAKENALFIKSKQMMHDVSHDEQTELEIFGKVKVMNKYVFSSYLEFFRGTAEGKKLKRGCSPFPNENLNP